MIVIYCQVKVKESDCLVSNGTCTFDGRIEVCYKINETLQLLFIAKSSSNDIVNMLFV